MSVRMAPPLSLILLLMFSEVSGDGWGVNYISSHMCALEGSSVIIPCTYTYPPEHQVKTVFWTKPIPETGIEPPDMSNDYQYRHRIQYLGDKQHNCTIRLNHVKQTDSHKYYFGFTTNVTNRKRIGTSGVTLAVTDLQVETHQRVKEGDSVALTCKTTCRLTEETTFIWYRNTQTLTDTNNELIVPSVRREDPGIYSCAVQGHNLTSPALFLNVTYPPENVSASISFSGVIVEGDSVNLTCSSESNPPVHIYSWFKGKKLVGSGKKITISNIRSDHSGQYKCKVFNECGMSYSNAVILNVMYAPRNVSASISSSGVIVEGDSVNLICSSESNPPVHIYSWFKENQTSSVGSGQTFSISNINSHLSGWFYCVAQNKYGSQRSAAVLVIFDGRQNALLYSGIISGFGGFFIIFITVLICKKKRRPNNNNVRGEQENHTTHEERVPKMRDDPSENIYTNYIPPACNVSEGVCDSPADADSSSHLYGNLEPENMFSDEHHDDLSHDIYINPDMCRSFESVHDIKHLP